MQIALTKALEKSGEIPLGREIFCSFYYFFLFKRLLETKVKNIVFYSEPVALRKKTREFAPELFVCFLLVFGLCSVDQDDALGL